MIIAWALSKILKPISLDQAQKFWQNHYFYKRDLNICQRSSVHSKGEKVSELLLTFDDGDKDLQYKILLKIDTFWILPQQKTFSEMG